MSNEMLTVMVVGVGLAFLVVPPSAGRPPEAATAEQVQMQMEHRLPGVAVAVHHGAIAALGDAELLRHLLRREIHLPDQHVVIGFEVVDARDVLLRYHEHVYGCLRLNVAKGEHRVIFEHGVRLDLAVDHPANKAITAHASLLVRPGLRALCTALGAEETCRSGCATGGDGGPLMRACTALDNKRSKSVPLILMSSKCSPPSKYTCGRPSRASSTTTSRPYTAPSGGLVLWLLFLFCACNYSFVVWFWFCCFWCF